LAGTESISNSAANRRSGPGLNGGWLRAGGTRHCIVVYSVESRGKGRDSSAF
jgi:hypothetical protein